MANEYFEVLKRTIEDFNRKSQENDQYILDIEDLGERWNNFRKSYLADLSTIEQLQESADSKLRVMKDIESQIMFANERIDHNNAGMELDKRDIESGGLERAVKNRTAPRAEEPPVWVDILIQAEKTLIPFMTGTWPSDKKKVKRAREALRFCKIYDDVRKSHNLKHSDIRKHVARAGGSENLPAKYYRYMDKYSS